MDEIIVSPLLRFLQTEPSNAMCEWKGWWRKVVVRVGVAGRPRGVFGLGAQRARGELQAAAGGAPQDLVVRA